MGNSNSTQHANNLLHHQQPLQWSQSLDPPDSRNRMKKGYFPPRHYIGHGHGGMVPPQKVLPAVNPAKAALRLKPTSNGAILHGGGTISGRKLQLLNELHDATLESSSSPTDDPSLQINRAIRKRHLSASSLVNGGSGGSVIDPSELVEMTNLSGGTSTPNLSSMDFHASDYARRSQRSISGHTIIFDKGSGSSYMKGGSGIGGSVSGRDYDSEPDMRMEDGGMTESVASTMGDRSVSPLPNSFTLISESPAKKQIRTKKKYQAPPPPPENLVMMMGPAGPNPPRQFHHGHGPSSMDPHFNMPGANEFNASSHRASTNSNSSGAGPAGGKKKLTRLFKTKAQSKMSSASHHQKQQQQQVMMAQAHEESQSDERRILAESIIMGQAGISPAMKNVMNSNHTSYNSNNNNNSNNHHHSSNHNSSSGPSQSQSQWTSASGGSSNNHASASPSHMGMTTTSPEQQFQQEKFRHSSPITHNLQQVLNLKQSHLSEQQLQQSSSSSSAEGRRLSSMSTELAAAAAALGKKKKPFAPLCSTKEDSNSASNRDSPRGGAPLSQEQQQPPSREVTSAREPVTPSKMPSANGSSSHNQHPSPSHNISKSSNHNHNSQAQSTQFLTQGASNVNKYGRREQENGHDGATKKTFYFGQDMGTSASTSAVQEVFVSQSKQQQMQGQHEETSSDQNQNITATASSNKRVISSSTKSTDKLKNNQSPPSPNAPSSYQDHRQQLKAGSATNLNTSMNPQHKMNDSHHKNKFTNGHATHSISEEPSDRLMMSSSGNSNSNGNSNHNSNHNSHVDEFPYKNKGAQVGQRSSSHSRVETELKVTMQSNLNSKISAVMTQNKIQKSVQSKQQMRPQQQQQSDEEEMRQYPDHLPPPAAFSSNNGNSATHTNNNNSNKIIHNVISSNKHHLSNKNHMMNLQEPSPRSDSDSDGFRQHPQLIQQQSQHQQQHPNMKLRQQSKKKSDHNLTGVGVLNIGDSSSDLSSSEVDIPLLIRPTLPQRRLDLPRFSPSAAWRALDSPRASGRSLSSEDGFSYEDRIQRYTRPSAPPRNNNERSGDSGISAGDAGSPANAPDIGGRTSSCSYNLSNHHSNNPEGGSNNNNKLLRKNKIRGSSPIKNVSDGKCWTPEQDLDESSSEFEHDVDLGISPHIGSSDEVLESDHQSNGPHNLVPIGLQTPPKFTTRSQLFAKNSNNPPPSKVESHIMYNSKMGSSHHHNNSSGSGGKKYNGNGNGSSVNRFTGEPQSLQIHNLQRQHLYTRSTKANSSSSPNSASNNLRGHHSSIVEIIPDDGSNDLNENGSGNGHISDGPVRSSYASRQFEREQQELHGFIGLDTNWFLSRSEPNLLRAQDVTMEGQSSSSSRRIHPRLSVMQDSPVSNEPLDFLDKVFPQKMREARAAEHLPQRQRPLLPKSRGYLEKEKENLHFEDEDGRVHDEVQFSEDDNDLLMMGNDGEVRSEIGYGPSSMNFYTPSAYQKQKQTLQQQSKPTNSPLYDEGSKASSLILFRRPFSFSHIMYLPSYDSRRLHHPTTSSSAHHHHYPNNRRTKSVDNLDSSSQLKLFRPSNHHSNTNLSNSNEFFDFDEEHPGSLSDSRNISHHNNHNSTHFHHQSRKGNSKSDFNYSNSHNHNSNNNNNHSSRKEEVENNSQFNFSRSQSVPGPRVIEHKITQESHQKADGTISNAVDQKQQQQIDQEKRRQEQINEKKKKFKFQSTLRVLERKKIEKELTREAEEKEMQRLREIESMRRVEEEFQKKRAHKEQAVELTTLKENNSKAEGGGPNEEWADVGHHNNVTVNNMNSTGSSHPTGAGAGASNNNNKNMVRNIHGRNFSNHNNYQESNDDSCGGGGGGGRSSSATSGSKSIATVTTVSTNNTSPHHLNRQRLSSSSSTTATGAHHQLHHNDGSNIHSSMSNSSSSTSNNNNHNNNHNSNNSSKMIMSNSSSSSKLLHMAQRQEPEGAPAFSTTTDLRKELIHASRKRNGTGSTSTQGGSGSSNGTGGHHGNNHSPQHHRSGSSELTHELSEYRQETRQYCDYRRSPRTNSASPARFAESSNSDIFPLSRRAPVERSKQSRYRSTVHPEVVCDIPGKPFPFMVNFSRLSGSTSNLVMDDRPGSGLGLGGGNTSGPSSVISDNYRRDWAHHIRGSGGSSHGGGGPGRASSVASLHSAPGYTSDHLRHSSTDLTIQADSPRVIHKSRKSPLFQKYSHSPPSSPLPPLSSNISDITDLDKDGSSIVTSTNGPPSGVFQLQPFNKAKGYRPVAFKPSPSSSHAIKLTSTTVN